jgi:predicted metal-dependent hydrolase
MNLDSMEILALPSGPAPVRWRRSKRARRVSLRIDPRGGAVVVTLPPRATRSTGMALLMTNAEWVRERLAALPVRVTFGDGALVPLYGEAHPVRHVPSMRGAARLVDGEIHVSGDAEFLPRRVGDFLRGEARRALVPAVTDKAAQIGRHPARITLKDTTSRWGSCTATGNLAFSWRLVMAPRFVQDYVVAHEVAHLRHMNHGRQFWALVDQISPHTETAMDWLRRDGLRLLRVG